MVFAKLVKGSEYELTKPFATFMFISLSVGLGMMLFTLILYALIQMATSSGFTELSAISGDDDDPERERIDDNDELEDV